ncbi:MAG: lysozyme [Burkholderiales bacterium]|nr:lysozyme [Burkholderiales bacterium]
MADPSNSRRIAAAIAIATGIAVPSEGLRRVAYYDPPGVLTVCYGSTGGIDPHHVYSLAECRARLDRQMLQAVEAVEHCAPGLPPNQLAAWADAVYNIGPTIVCNPSKSTAARMLRAHQYEAACRQLPRWDKASVAGVMVSLPGLTRRRALEMAVCLDPSATP